MPRYEVCVVEHVKRVFEVEAGDEYVARGVAAETYEGLPVQNTTFDADVIKQVGEPWASPLMIGGLWYDLHGPGDVICAKRAMGNAFNAEDVALLRSRIEQVLGVKVIDYWNGAGYNQVSYRCTGRTGTDRETKSQRAAILAPRPELCR